MKIFILYETYNIEFFGKYILGKYLISKINEPVEIQVGYYRDLILKIFKCKPNEKVIIIGNQIYYTNTVLIDLYNYKNFIFLPQHEEEHALFSVNKKNYFENLLSKDYFSKFHKYLCFNNETKKDFKNFLKINNNQICSVGNAKYDLLKLIKNYRNFSNLLIKQNKYILVTLPDSFFKAALIYFSQTRNRKKFKLSYKNDTFIGNRSVNEQISHYFYIKSFLKNVMKLAKKNSRKEIILRPHPSDYEYLGKLKKVFKNYKNITINTQHQIYHWINKSKIVISSPASPIIDCAILERKVICFYDKSNKYHKFLFSRHPSLNFKNLKIVSNLNFKSMSKIIKTSRMPKISKKILPPEKPHFENIYNEIAKINFKKKLNDNIFHDLLLKRVINFIEYQKEKKQLGFIGAKNFDKKFKFSMERLLAIIIFWKNPLKLDFLNILRKFTLGRSLTVANLEEWHGGLNQKIDHKNLKKFEKFFKKNVTFFKKSNYTLKNKKVIILKKIR